MELGGGAGVLASANCRKARVQLAAQRILASQGWRVGVAGPMMKRRGTVGRRENGAALNISLLLGASHPSAIERKSIML